jgi:hypothetical protein
VAQLSANYETLFYVGDNFEHSRYHLPKTFYVSLILLADRGCIYLFIRLIFYTRGSDCLKVEYMTGCPKFSLLIFIVSTFSCTLRLLLRPFYVILTF